MRDEAFQVRDAKTDLLEEGARARRILGEQPKLDVLARDVVSKTILGQVLFSLWDSGFYEYVLENPRFEVESAARSLEYDAAIFGYLVEYLAGWGLLRVAADPSSPPSTTREAVLELTEQGHAFTNAFSRGVLTLYIGGYQSILSQLGPLLRGEISVEDSTLQRSAAHAALGTENITCVSIVPAVIRYLEEVGVETVVDLGCGSGGFLLQWARLGETRHGIGVDMSREAISQARCQAETWRVSDRVTFLQGEVGTSRMRLPTEIVDRADAVTAMYMLHEFGRDGRGRIVEVISSLKRSFPGKRFIFLEAPPVDPFALGAADQSDHFLLDYLLVHPLSRQGLPRTPEDWASIAEDAGCGEFEHRSLGGITNMLIARF